MAKVWLPGSCPPASKVPGRCDCITGITGICSGAGFPPEIMAAVHEQPLAATAVPTPARQPASPTPPSFLPSPPTHTSRSHTQPAGAPRQRFHGRHRGCHRGAGVHHAQARAGIGGAGGGRPHARAAHAALVAAVGMSPCHAKARLLFTRPCAPCKIPGAGASKALLVPGIAGLPSQPAPQARLAALAGVQGDAGSRVRSAFGG